MKKLLMKWFPNYFHVVNVLPLEELEINPALQILDISDSDYTREALGINDEVATNIARIVQDNMNKHERCTSVMAEVSKHCKHANELYFAIVVMNSYVDKMKNPFQTILMDMFNQGENQ